MDEIRVDLDALDALIYRLRDLRDAMELLGAELGRLRRSLDGRNGREEEAAMELYRQVKRMEESADDTGRLIRRVRYAGDQWEACEAENMARAEALAMPAEAWISRPYYDDLPTTMWR